MSNAAPQALCPLFVLVSSSSLCLLAGYRRQVAESTNIILELESALPYASVYLLGKTEELFCFVLFFTTGDQAQGLLLGKHSVTELHLQLFCKLLC